MHFKNSSKDHLLDYLTQQLGHFFPDGKIGARKVLAADIDEALERLRVCINALVEWTPEEFNYLHSTQYTTFLYFISNTIWNNRKNEEICTKLFLLNKALNGIDLFYEVEMPNIFCIGHSTGIVLAKAHYSNYFAVFQNSTVGKNHGIGPSLGEGVIMYPNTAIIGECKIGANTIIAQGVSVISQNTPGSTLVFQGDAGHLIHKPIQRMILSDIFRNIPATIGEHS